MPTYEYRCPAGHAFEKFSPTMTAGRRVKCPTCGKPAERQISGGAGLVFKGSGFYGTDYRSPSYQQAAQADQARAKAAAEKPSTTDTTGTTSQGKAADSGNSSAKKAK